MPDEVPWQVEEFVPDGETVVYADRATLQRPFLKIKYHGWVALTDQGFHFRGRTSPRDWVFPPTPTRSKEKHIDYDDLDAVERAHETKAKIKAPGQRFYFWLRRNDDEQTAHWHRRQSRFIRRVRKKAPDADVGVKDKQYPFFRKVEMPPHEAMNPRQLREAIERGGEKLDRHGETWDDDEDE